MIYLIGGAPRTGKSTLAKLLVKRDAIPFLSTDVILHMVSDTLPELRLTKPYADIPEKFGPFVANLVKHVQSSHADYAIEGDLLTPKYVSELQKIHDIRSCFLGFSTVTLSGIQEHVGENDWLADLSDADRQSLPGQIMERSRSLQRECEQYGIRYVDMADGAYDQNLEVAYGWLTNVS